ncbi:hypothetical protein AMTRI_Chr04g244300 [Amborella trichopoda]|uniref:UV-B-induced protein At3g17800, chloroplastic n=1 Tax=Amborella trichopoda TaxID=13333 RepID=W1PSI6_AMBTC|nr:UV-B-induced protein At3g17800, chloroplastic [Amborella trichopoda]XP_020526034.1 UV-B-induced protein At3g17800, chloroplastic [Amborella trichopoda]XP_020526035.1 UV-B-induced protein At3g17800, chloroplastic [Amborella trichopoda]XP_020526036.1 UV-B-induced protein At3g17800, chloroplastic [Amborella trichopoda]XP_020526037.1 UV-B-induced protein At3g17800, chloroplastic [Amborella trichopoda]ERN11008.1 hypothetical protein AMTR_s00024p00021530 [Amborella trichopoda]|eukprot:XP_011625238.1 UV-B-induced protein At3g17800, chloroplastic [Amborella trichopoda]
MEAVAVSCDRSGFHKPCVFSGRSSILFTHRLQFLSFESISTFANSSLKYSPSVVLPKHVHTRMAQRSRRNMVAKASMDSNGDSGPIAPLQMESPIGQFLSQILKNHPHLLPAAVDQQLEQLQTDRDSESEKEEPSPSGTDLVLYRRIAEVKANERRKALEEIIYALIVQKFMDAEVSLIPSVSSSPDNTSKVDTWPNQVEKLEKMHSPEALQMIRNHLALILGNRLSDLSSVAQISKLRVGQVYAASVMYGYFLKRVDQRFQLEKAMKVLPFGVDSGNLSMEQVLADDSGPKDLNNQTKNLKPNDQAYSGNPTWYEASHGSEQDGVDMGVNFSPGGFGYGLKSYKLRSYVMSFDAETLQRYATIRSKESVSIIEKHTEALFGRPELRITPQGTVDSSKDENIKISFGGLTTLVLEAVTFGSFLWDVESYVDSRYHFVTN